MLRTSAMRRASPVPAPRYSCGIEMCRSLMNPAVSRTEDSLYGRKRIRRKRAMVRCPSSRARNEDCQKTTTAPPTDLTKRRPAQRPARAGVDSPASTPVVAPVASKRWMRVGRRATPAASNAASTADIRPEETRLRRVLWSMLIHVDLMTRCRDGCSVSMREAHLHYAQA